MQGKGFIKVVAVLLLLLCAYQLVFTWKSNQIEQTAKNEALAYGQTLVDVSEIDKEQMVKEYKQEYLDSIYDEPVFLGRKYRQVKESSLKLGLDLQGGMSVVLEADIRNLLENLADNSQNQNFIDALDAANKAQQFNQEEYVDLFLKNFKGNDAELVGLFQNADNINDIPTDAGKEQVRAYLKDEAEDAFNSTYDIITSRIDKFGLSQPSINKQPTKKRIIVEIPGVDNPARVRELLVSTANLEFYEMHTNADFAPYLNEIYTIVSNEVIDENEELFSSLSSDNTQEDSSEEKADGSESTDDEDKDSLDTNGFEELLSDDSEDADSLQMMQDKMREKFPLNPFSPQFGLAYVIGSVQDENLSSVKRDTGQINKILRRQDIQALFPANVKLVWDAKIANVEDQEGNNLKQINLYALRPDVDGQPQLDGGVIVNAESSTDPMNNEPIVNMQMNMEGAQIWSELTERNTGKPIAVVLDNKLYSNPAPEGRIDGGSSRISGDFTVLETKDLATILKTGKLDVPAKIIEEEVVGPTIGGESAKAGLISLIAGLVLVLVFMALYYGKAGLIADLALLFNIILVIGILAAFGSVLTLPGIAGLVLTIGMAVDANVIIFERVRENLRAGLELPSAVRRGYQDSYSAIIDANVTTFIIALILGGFGIGPIKGFAAVLIIGIITSFFTAVLFTRVIKDDMLAKKKSITYWTGLSKTWFQNINQNFVGKRKIAYVISGLIVVASLGNLIINKGNAFDLGVDLSAGRSYTIRFDEAKDASNVKDALDNAFSKNYDGVSNLVRTFGSDEQLKITTSLLTDQAGLEIDKKATEELYNALRSFLPENTSQELFESKYLLSSQKVDSSIADDLRKQSTWLTLASLLAIFIYLLIRFRKWQFGLAAVVTLAHDTLVILAVFSFLRGVLPFALEVDQAFIAALLTIIGYSINDTVIVFDRIREELRLNPKDDYKSVINQALNSTLSRTIITSLTTLFVVLLLFIFGGEVIRGFAFALLIGIIVGTYSSIFVATPIVVDLFNKGEKKAK